MGMIMNTNALGALFEPSRDAVIGIEDNKICFANPAAQRFFALSPGADAPFPTALFQDVERAEAAFEINGRMTDVSIRLLDGIYLLFLHPQESVDTKGKSAASARMTHLFSDSLMNLRMALDSLIRRFPPHIDSHATDYAAVMYREYYRLRRLCNHLSIVERIEEGKLPCSDGATDLEKVVRELVETVKAVAEGLGIEIRLLCDSGDYITAADSSLLELMLLNLITNSLQRCEKGDSVVISLRRGGSNFILSVDDTGSGMTTASLSGAMHGELPFDLLDNRSGAGLGLIIAKGIVGLHNGTMILESAEGQGCHVRVSLPIQMPKETILRHPAAVYEVKDMNGILTELSVVLPLSCYQEKFFD